MLGQLLERIVGLGKRIRGLLGCQADLHGRLNAEVAQGLCKLCVGHEQGLDALGAIGKHSSHSFGVHATQHVVTHALEQSQLR